MKLVRLFSRRYEDHVGGVDYILISIIGRVLDVSKLTVLVKKRQMSISNACGSDHPNLLFIIK